jgi:hypothetical protein
MTDRVKRTHYRDVIDIDSNRYEGGFTITITDADKGAAVLHFERWWLVYLTEHLGRILNAEQDEIENIAHRMAEAVKS